MSKITDAILACQSMAHDIGDDYGFEPETAEVIAAHFKLPVEFVQQALNYEGEKCESE